MGGLIGAVLDWILSPLGNVVVLGVLVFVVIPVLWKGFMDAVDPPGPVDRR